MCSGNKKRFGLINKSRILKKKEKKRTEDKIKTIRN